MESVNEWCGYSKKNRFSLKIVPFIEKNLISPYMSLIANLPTKHSPNTPQKILMLIIKIASINFFYLIVLIKTFLCVFLQAMDQVAFRYHISCLDIGHISTKNKSTHIPMNCWGRGWISLMLVRVWWNKICFHWPMDWREGPQIQCRCWWVYLFFFVKFSIIKFQIFLSSIAFNILEQMWEMICLAC